MTDRFLPTALRRALERTVKAARDVAEEGAADAVRRLGVADAAPPAHLDAAAKALRRRLRAHARTLGDMVTADGVHEVRNLVEATGYAQWHRRLFARFLAERGLLRHPEHGPVTLEDCEELAKLEGLTDAWAAAEAYGAKMLPGVFLPDDPVLSLEHAPEHAQALRRLVDGLDAAIFQADDSLGWTYQFWRAAEKDRVNKAGEKIGARDLPAVTQLFTEPYMVKFLLHNTLGAWRAGKVLAAQPNLAADAADEATLRLAVSPPGYAFDMLRFVREGEDAPRWRPAAGTFPGWPEAAAAIRALDPCCGSGHFLTEVLAILSALRADEEGLADAAAVAAVLRDNLFGLELDGRCVQIAAFAVALTAWRIGGFQPFGPEQVHIAWVGAPPPLDRGEFLALANGDDELRQGLAGLHDLFVQAPLLGSLIDPTGGDLMSAQRLGRIEPLLSRLVEVTRSTAPERSEGAVAARGMADAARILGGQYVLIATNPPFVTRQAVEPGLREWLDRNSGAASADLSVAILEAMTKRLVSGGTISFVLPTNSFYQPAYRKFRRDLMSRLSIISAARLGAGAFREVSGEVVKVSLFTIGDTDLHGRFWSIDAASQRAITEKQAALSDSAPLWHSMSSIMADPDARIVIDKLGEGEKLNKLFRSRTGTRTGDNARILRSFWEPGMLIGGRYRLMQSVPDATSLYSGRKLILLWEQGSGALHDLNELGIASIQGMDSWGETGLAVGLMGSLPATIYRGEIYDMNTGVLYGASDSDVLGVFEWIKSGQFSEEIRKIDQQLKLTTATLVKVNYDAAYWRSFARERHPSGLPEPYSDDPTQWLFHGHPGQAEPGTHLHVALARLAGYRWPAECDPDMRLSAEARNWIGKSSLLPEVDNDGLLSLEAVAGEQPLAQRLRSFLAAAFGEAWSDALERRLVAEADHVLDKKVARDGSLEAWLRDRAFRQHSRLFHERPFLWQVWDGSPDGFSAFVHYHRLDAATLGKLTYTVLGDWIARMTNADDARRIEAAKILQQKLTAILGGETPLDIFVRWKPLEQQADGWDPDIDDGIRLNIRPFIKAGVLRETPKIKWGVDRGNDVPSAPWFPIDKGKRDNDRHLTLADKRAARGAK